MTRFRVSLEGRSYDVAVEEIADSGTPQPASAVAVRRPVETAAVSLGPEPHVLTAPAKAGSPNSADATAVPSPLAGKVVSIDVKLGQAVAEGVQVATIEAMKMNTYVFAPRSGAVTAIEAHPGDMVEDGATLLRIA